MNIVSNKLRILFLANGAFNVLGAIILIFAPYFLGQLLGASGNFGFVFHLLAVCSLSLGALSFCAIKFQESAALNSVVVVFCIFHGASALASVFEIANGLPPFVFANTAIHIVFLVLFIVLHRKST